MAGFLVVRGREMDACFVCSVFEENIFTKDLFVVPPLNKPLVVPLLQLTHGAVSPGLPSAFLDIIRAQGQHVSQRDRTQKPSWVAPRPLLVFLL